MKLRFLSIVLTTAGLLLSSSPSFAADAQATAPQAAASKAKTSTKAAQDRAAKVKAAAKIKLVDINSASAEELKKLPGITDATAAKIIAGRPYGSKAWLVSHHIIDMGVYEGLKQQVIAKQSNKDAAKNAALYSKKK